MDLLIPKYKVIWNILGYDDGISLVKTTEWLVMDRVCSDICEYAFLHDIPKIRTRNGIIFDVQNGNMVLEDTNLILNKIKIKRST